MGLTWDSARCGDHSDQKYGSYGNPMDKGNNWGGTPSHETYNLYYDYSEGEVVQENVVTRWPRGVAGSQRKIIILTK